MSEAEYKQQIDTDTEIPRFNLAEQIMAEQRKVTAIKRKAPAPKNKPFYKMPPQGVPEWTCGKNPKPQSQSIGYRLEKPIPTAPEQQQLIAEIVAGDIERFCSGDYSTAC